MKILFLSDNFPPEVNAPASRSFEHCREWARSGHVVTVITCVPNFPRGKVYPGYRNRLWQEEEMEGIRTLRVWSYITSNAGFLRRIVDYVSYAAAAFLASLFVPRPDVVVGTSPQFFTVCSAGAASCLRRVPFVFELRDLWPESIKAVGAMEDSPAIRFLEKVEMFLYRKAARIVSVTESFKNVLVRRGIEGDKIEVVTNGADLSRFKPRAKDTELVERYGLRGKFVAGYVGTHGMAHALETLLEAAAALGRKSDDFRIILLGDGARKNELREKAGEMGLVNVLFLDSVSKEDVTRYWSLLEVSIIHLKRTDLFKTVIPSKLFECMAMGIPVLHGVAGESAAIVEKEGVGLVFEPENAVDLCEKMIQLKNDPALYGKLKDCCIRAAGNYDRTVLARRMLGVLEEAAGKCKV